MADRFDKPEVRRWLRNIALEGQRQAFKEVINRLEILEIGATATPPMSRKAMVAQITALLAELRKVVAEVPRG